MYCVQNTIFDCRGWSDLTPALGESSWSQNVVVHQLHPHTNEEGQGLTDPVHCVWFSSDWKAKHFLPRTKSTYTWKQPQQTRDQNYHQPSFQIRVTQGFKQVHVLTPIPFNASRFASEQRVVYLGEVIKRWDNVMWEHHGLFAIHLIIKKPLLVSHLNLEGTAGKPANNMSLKHNLNPATPRLRPHSTVWVQMVQNVAK